MKNLCQIQVSLKWLLTKFAKFEITYYDLPLIDIKKQQEMYHITTHTLLMRPPMVHFLLLFNFNLQVDSDSWHWHWPNDGVKTNFSETVHEK